MSRLFKNIIYNFSGRVIILVFGFFSVGYIFHELGEEVYGIMSFVFALDVVLLSSLNKGVSSTTIREISGNIEYDKKYVRSFVQTWSMICWAAYLLFVVVVYFLAPVLVKNWINIKTIDSETAVFMVRILGWSTLLNLPSSFYMSILNGMQRMEFPNLIKTLAGIFQRIGIIIILSKITSVSLVIYWIAFINVSTVLAGFIFSRRLLPIRSLLPIFSAEVLKKNIKFGLQMSLISIFSILQKQADKITISKLLPIGALGYYSFAFNNVANGMMISQAISRAAYPDLCDKYKNNSHEDLVKQFNKLQDFICYINVPVFLLIIFIAQPLFTYVFSAEVFTSLELPIAFLCFCFYMNGTLNLPYRLLLAVGRPEIAAKHVLYTFFITIPLTVLFVYFWGLNGAAIGLGSYFMIGYIYIVPKIFRECLRAPTYNFFIHLGKILFFTTITYGIGLTIIKGYRHTNLSHIVLVYLSATIIYFVISYFFIGNDLRKTINQHFSKYFNYVYYRFGSMTNQR